MFDYPTCRVCEGRIAWGRWEQGYDMCRLCTEAQETARQEDLAQGIQYRCPECYEPNGMHLEGQCGQWRDSYE